MTLKTDQTPESNNVINGYPTHLFPPKLTQSRLTIPREKPMNNNNNKIKEKSFDRKSYIGGSENNKGRWNLGSLMVALPFTPSPVISSSTNSSPSSSHSASPFCDRSRVSVEFYTPTHHCMSVLSSLSFRKQEQSPKCKSISSTLYESALDHQGYDNNNKLVEKIHGNALEICSYSCSPKSLIFSTTPYDHESFTAEVDNPMFSCPISPFSISNEKCFPSMKFGDVKCKNFTMEELNATAEKEENSNSPLVYRPRPYQEFLEEVQEHKDKVELDAKRKAIHTDLFNKLKRKEADIDCWETSERSKAEFQLDRIERKLDKKRANAAKKMQQKVAKAKMEAERKKTRIRTSVTKEMKKLVEKSQGNKPTPTTLCLCFP